MDEFNTELGGGFGGEAENPAQVAGSPLPPPKAEPETAPTGEYDSYVSSLVRNDERKSAASRSMAQAITKNPDEYARYVRLSKLTGMDPELLLEDAEVRGEAERRVKMGGLDFDSLIKTNPKTADFLSDPENATIAQDDLPFFQRVENVFKSLGSGYRTAEGQEETFSLARKLMDTGGLSPVEQARLEKLQGDEAHKSRLEQNQPWTQDWARDLGYSMRQFMKSTEAAAFGAGAGGLVGFGAGSAFPVVGNVAGGTAGIVAGGVTGAANYAYDMERAGAFLELSRVRDLNDQPIDRRTIKAVANGIGVVNAVIESASDVVLVRMVPGVKSLMGKLGPDAAKVELRRRAAEALRNPTTRQIIGQAAMKIGGMASVEGIEEFAQALMGAGGREVAQAASGQQFKDDSLSDDVKQASDEAMRAFRGTLLMMSPVGALHYSTARQQQARVQQNKAFFEALSGAVTDSKAHQRLPEKTREFIESLKQDSEVKEVFIDADRVNQYFQSKGLDAGAVMEQVMGPEGADQFQQALALKGDMIIPIEVYAEKLAGTEHHQGLAEDLRLRQGDESEREFKISEANLSQDEKVLRDMAEVAHQRVAEDEPAQRVFHDMYGEALAAGASPSQASAWAAIEAARYRTRASRIEGADAYSLWREEGGINVRRPLPDVLAQYQGSEPRVDSLLNAMRERKIPMESPGKALTEEELTLRGQAEELGRVLDDFGLDIDTLTNEQIRAQLFRQEEFDTEGGAVYNAGVDDQTYAQPLDVYQYSNGLFGLAGDDFVLAAPQDIGAWAGGTRSISYDIMSGRERLGTVVLAMRGAEVIGLSAITINEERRGQGAGRAVVKELLDTYGRLEVYGIRDSAKGFWNKLGVKYDETQSEFERNGVIEAHGEAGARRTEARRAAAGGTFGQAGRTGRLARPNGNERTVAGTAPRQNWVTGTAIRGRDGLPLALLRGENRPLNPDDFKPEAFGYNTGHASSSRGVHFTNSIGVAEKHGTVRRYWLDIRKPFVIESDDEQYSHIETPEQYFAWRESLREKGYDGIIISTKNSGSTRVDIVTFDPEQVIPAPDQPTFYQSQKADRLKLTGMARHWVIRNERMVDWNRVLGKSDGADILSSIVKARVAVTISKDGINGLLDLDLSAYLEAIVAQGGGFHNEELAQAIRMYRSDKSKATKVIEKWATDNRKEVLNEWRKYLTEGNDVYANDPFFQDYVWGSITSELRNNRPDVPVSLNPAALALVYDALIEQPDGRKFMPLYSSALEQVSIGDIGDNAVDIGAEKEWIKIPQTAKNSPDYEKNVGLLRNLSCSTWCTSRGMEKEYVTSGDFWVLRHGGETKLAVRFKDDEVAEIQGQRNDGTIPAEYAPDVEALVNSGSIKLNGRSTAALSWALIESARLTRIQTMNDAKVVKYFGLRKLMDGTYEFTPPSWSSKSVKTIDLLMKSAAWPRVSTINGDLALYEGASAPNITSVGGNLYIDNKKVPVEDWSKHGILAKNIKTFYQSAPVWYSSLERSLRAVNLKSAPAKQWLGTIRSLKGVKSDEIKWSGIEEWLELQGNRKVTAGEVAQFVATNGVRIEERFNTTPRDLDIDQIPDWIWDDANDRAREGMRAENPNMTEEEFERFLDDEGSESFSSWATELAFQIVDEEGWGTGGAYSEYVLPGAEKGSYRELLLKLPEKYEVTHRYFLEGNPGSYPSREALREDYEAVTGRTIEEDGFVINERIDSKLIGGFRDNHWPDDLNVVAHVRFNERVDIDGKRVLFIEEFQAGWAQAGREKKFKGQIKKSEIGARWIQPEVPLNHDPANYPGYWQVFNKATGELLVNNPDPTATTAEQAINSVFERWMPVIEEGKISPAPFVTSTGAWVGLILKRMIRYAAEEGFDRIAWTTGDQQNERWRLDKHVDKIVVNRSGENYDIMAIKGNEPVDLNTDAGRDMPASGLDGFLGKELADKIRAQNEDYAEYSGLDLRVGGEGMRAFYDRIVPNVANELLKKLGGEKVTMFNLGDAESVHQRSLTDKNMIEAFQLYAPGAREGRFIADTAEHAVSIVMDSGWVALRSSLIDDLNLEPAQADSIIGHFLAPKLKAQPGFDITPALRENALSGMPLFQKKRGSVTFGENYRLIQLLEDADLSTFLHELGHTWLEELRADAQRDGASGQVRADWEMVRAWLGVGPDEATPVEAHEQWARGIEAYFMEGDAPSIALREIFQKFKAWMQSVYKSLTELDVKLNDDVRAVFDRLIATDEEIETARRFQAYAPMFSSPEQAGMTTAEWAAYGKATEGARADAQAQVTRRVMRELRRENEKWWKEELARVEGAVREEALKMPVYRALHLLTRGEFAEGGVPEQPIKLSKQALIAIYGEPYLKELSPQKLRTSGWVYSADGGVHPDVVAGMTGFDSGDEMIKAITSAAPMREWVEAEAKQRMLELHGDMLNDGSLAEEALQAVHNGRQADVLETELRILRRKRAEAEPILRAKRAEDREAQQRGRQLLDFNIPAAVLRDLARREIGAMRVSQVNPTYYAHAEARAGREAFDLAAKQDYDGAAEAKQRQIMNHFFYREAVRARKDVDRGVGHMKRLSATKARARIGRAGQEWLGQLDAILERYSLAPLSQQSKARSLLEWAKAVEQATGESIALSPEVLDEAHMINYRELTVDQFRALHDSVSSIEHVARKITQVMRNGRAYEKNETIKALVDAAEHAITSVRPLPETEKVYGQARTFFELTKGFFASNLRPEKIIERLDGGTSGIWHDLFWNPAVDAQTRRDDLRILIMKPLAEFLHKKMPKERQARLSDVVHLQSLGKSLTRRTLIGVALNVGNASNRDKLMRGGMWFGEDWTPISDTQLTEMLNQLDRGDWEMVQMMWDSVAQLYPHLDDLNRRAVGLPLNRIEPTPLNTEFGVFAGGYWPAVADPRHSKVGERQENAEALITDVFAPRYPKAATAHSFREARTEAAYPVQLDWERVLSSHIDKAITDIAYHEWVKQSRRLLEDQRVKKVIQNRLGEYVYRGLEEWLVHQVRPVHGGYSGNVAVDNITNAIVSNTAIAALGFKAATAIGNVVVAPVQASHQVGPLYMVRSLAKYLANPVRATEAVFALSGEMRHRFEHLDQTFNVITKTLEGRDTFRAVVGRLAMDIHRQADRITSTFIWAAKYQQEIDAGQSPEQAARLADKTIRTTQMAGAPKDLSSFERDPRYRMFKMFIGPMIVMQNELRGSVAGKGVKAVIAPKVWATALATWILPAVLFELAVGRGPDDGDDLDWWEWALLKILVYPALTVPFIRDGANAIEQMVEGKGAMTRSNPLADLTMLAGKAVHSLFKEDAEMGDYVKSFTRLAGVAFGMPVGQGILIGEFLYGTISGERPLEEPADVRYLIYKRKDE